MKKFSRLSVFFVIALGAICYGASEECAENTKKNTPVTADFLRSLSAMDMALTRNTLANAKSEESKIAITCSLVKLHQRNTYQLNTCQLNTCQFNAENGSGTLLDVALLHNLYYIVQALVSQQISLEHMTTFRRALIKLTEEDTVRLIERCNPWDLRDNEQRTILHCAIDDEKGKVALGIIKIAPDGFLDAQDKYDMTALHRACALKKRKIIQALLGKGTDRKKKDVTGKTALHYGVLKDSVRIVRLLADNSCINEPDMRGRTPLHYAVQLNIRLALCLARHGADWQAKNNDGFTPLSLVSFDTQCKLFDHASQDIRGTLISSQFTNPTDWECRVCLQEKSRCVAPCSKDYAHWMCTSCLNEMLLSKPYSCSNCRYTDLEKTCEQCHQVYHHAVHACPHCATDLVWKCSACQTLAVHYPDCTTCRVTLDNKKLHKRYFTMPRRPKAS